jgi:hypothetical protein
LEVVGASFDTPRKSWFFVNLFVKKRYRNLKYSNLLKLKGVMKLLHKE